MSKASNLIFYNKVNNSLPIEYQKLYMGEKEVLQDIIKKDQYVCDIGSGGGRTINDINSITSNIIGVDYDQDAINLLQIRYPELTFIVADAINLPFSNDSFDAVTCMMSWLNFGDKKEKSLEEMNRVLKHNGVIIMSMFNENALSTRLKVYEEIGIKIKEIIGGKVVFDESFGANTSEQFTQDELHNYLLNAGFKVEKILKIGVGYVCVGIKDNGL